MLTDDLMSQESEARHARALFKAHLTSSHRTADRLMGVLLLVQWLASIVVALAVTPGVWPDEVLAVRLHLWLSAAVGGGLTLLPVYLAWRHPGRPITRHTIAVAQMLWSAVLVLLTSGQFESHLHVFVSLAVLAWYRDPKVLATAAAVTIVEVALQSAFWAWPTYGSAAVALRGFEYLCWVMFEAVFLSIAMQYSLAGLRDVSEREARLDAERKRREREANERARDLETYAAGLESANQSLEQHAYTIACQTEHLLHAREAAVLSGKAKSEFLLRVSHRIRRPMSAVLHIVDDLLATLERPENTMAAKLIKWNSDYLLKLTDDILCLARIEAGQFELRRVHCSPEQITAEVVEAASRLAEEKSLSIERQVIGELPEWIVTDPIQWRFMLDCLLSNAIKFTERGGVRMVVWLDSADRALPRLCVRVEDTGLGMTESTLATIFDPFMRHDFLATRTLDGCGLSLAICRGLAQLLGGAIEVESAPDRGSRFTLSIDAGKVERAGARPEVRGESREAGDGSSVQGAHSHDFLSDDAPPNLLAAGPSHAATSAERTFLSASAAETGATVCDPTPCASPRASSHAHVLEGARILLAEDGQENQRFMSAVLTDEGALVTVVGDGQSAIDAALAAVERGEPFDAVILDMQMPIVDGYAAARRLRDAPYHGAILALTAFARGGERLRCLEAGCDDMATKPISRPSLVRLVIHHLRRPQLSQEPTPTTRP